MSKIKEEIKRKEVTKYTIKGLNILLLFLCFQIILTYSRFRFNGSININSEFLKYWLYSLGSVLIILLIGIYFLQGIYNQDKKSETFGTKNDFIFFIFPFSIITNYIFVVKPITFWTGSLLSDLFDILFIFSCVLFIIFIFIFFNRINYRKSYTSIADNNSDGFKSDNPIKLSKEDRLERKKFTDRIAECIVSQGNESLTIGIFGEWGSGKSSIYTMIKEELENKMSDNCIVFEFKPWYFGQENHEIIKIFLFQLIEEIKKDDGFDPQLDKELKRYLEYLSTLSVRPTGLIVSFKDLLDKYSPSKDTAKLSDIKKTIEEMLKKSRKRIVVLIDDVDRLDRDEMKMVFKLVRLIADFPNITYLLALDEDVVSNSLSEFYFEENSETKREQGRRYLDKFIQLPLYLPMPDQQKVSELCWDGIKKLLSEQEIMNVEKEMLLQHVRVLVFTPRNVFRFINLAKFFIPLLKGEVNSRDLLYLLLIQISSPKLYKFISENGLVFINDVEEKDLENIRKQFQEVLLGNTNMYKNILCDLFPYSEKLYDVKVAHTSTELKKTWFDEKRICSEKYFNQYFMYSLPKGELSHESLEIFVKNLSDDNLVFNSLYQEYNRIIDLHSIDDVNIKLLNRIDNCAPLTRVILVNIAIKLFGEIYGKSDKKVEIDSLIYLVKELSFLLNNTLDSTNLFMNECHLVLLVKTFNHLKKEFGNQGQLNNLRFCIKSVYETKFNIDFMKELYEADSKFLMINWVKFEGENTIKIQTSTWFKDKIALESFLEMVFAHKSNLDNNETLISNFVNTIRYLPDPMVKEIFEQIDPTTRNDLYDYKKVNPPLTGEFIYAKNILYIHIVEVLKGIQEVNISNRQPTSKPVQYIENGIQLIREFGSIEQEARIKEIENEMDKYNNEYNKARKEEEEVRKEINNIKY